MSFTAIKPGEISGNPFTRIGQQWMLITAGDEQAYNTMTASWGGLGVLWSKMVSFVFVRHTRHTFHFVEEKDYYSLCFFNETYRKDLNLLGTLSGRDGDKLAKTKLTTAFYEGVPYFNEAELVLICKKNYADELAPEHFLVQDIMKHYEAADYHRMYIGEIVATLQKDAE